MNINKKMVKIVLASALLIGVSALKYSFVWGTKSYFFSGFCIVAPLLGVFLGVGGTGLTMLFVKVWRFFMFGVFGSVLTLTAGLPTMLAALCWSLDTNQRKKNRFASLGVATLGVNVIVPLVCFLAFVMHPSVGYGWWYGLYWCIPIGLYGAQVSGVLRQSLFATALRSTFVAHALGSVLWCYCIAMTPEGWLALIPIVAIERLVMAAGMVLVYALAKKLQLLCFEVLLFCNVSRCKS